MLIVIFILLFLLLNYIYGFISFKHKLPILMYHSISKDKKEDLTVLLSELEKQFFYIQQNYNSIFLNEIENIKNNNNVIITFDDGYVNNLEFLVPLLEKYNLKSTIFLPFNFIGKRDQWNENVNNIMTFEQLKNLDKKYIQLGWHSFNHKSYKYLSIKEIEEDLNNCRLIIEKNKLNVIPAFAYPFGAYPKNKSIQKELFYIFEKFGIKYALRIGNKLNNLPLKNKYLIKRIDIKGNDNFFTFKWKLKYGRIKPF